MCTQTYNALSAAAFNLRPHHRNLYDLLLTVEFIETKILKKNQKKECTSNRSMILRVFEANASSKWSDGQVNGVILLDTFYVCHWSLCKCTAPVPYSVRTHNYRCTARIYRPETNRVTNAQHIYCIIIMLVQLFRRSTHVHVLQIVNAIRRVRASSRLEFLAHMNIRAERRCMENIIFRI